jgi:glycosyltransferase involved in cell wall biosynthesis
MANLTIYSPSAKFRHISGFYVKSVGNFSKYLFLLLFIRSFFNKKFNIYCLSLNNFFRSASLNANYMEEKLSDSDKLLKRLKERRIGKDVAPSAPHISVIIPAHNISAFINATLDSVLAQTYHDFEIIVVNDGSQDTGELEKVLDRYFDKIIYARQEALGVSEARNAAICLSRGDLIAFLDGDDLWLPDYLASQIQFLEENKLDMVYADAELFGDNFLSGRTYMETTPSKGEVNPVSLLRADCNVITSGTVVRREKLEEVNLFDTNSKRAQDFDLWFRLAKHGAKIGYQKKVLLKYRVSSMSLSGSNIQRAERNITILEMIGSKYELTAAEQYAWMRQMEFSRAETELEKGKFYLKQGDYQEAQKSIRTANIYYRKPKLYLLIMLLKVSPALALKLFKKLRPAEFSFITTDQTPPG